MMIHSGLGQHFQRADAEGEMEGAAAAVARAASETGEDMGRGLRVSWLALEDDRWKSLLSSAPHGPYQAPPYQRLISSYLGGRGEACLVEGEGASCLLPLVVRELPPGTQGGEGWRDACSPPPYGGPLFLGDPAQRPALLERFVEACRDERILAVYLRNHPALDPEWRVAPEGGSLLSHGETVYQDLSLPDEDVWKQVTSRRRRGIRKAERAGYRVELDDWSLYPSFQAIYAETMERHGASPFWRFSRAYFDDLREQFGEHLHLCTVRAPSGEVASAGLYLLVGDTLEYHLGGTAEAHRQAAPSHLLYDYIARWGRAQGASLFHLGGGLPSLLEFKGGFSPSRAPIYSLRLVSDAAAYQELLRRNHLNGPVDGSAGFFPAYRRPE